MTSIQIKLPRVMLIAVIGLPLLWLSVAATMAGVYTRRSPDVALAWWPWSADAAATKSSRLVLADADARTLTEVKRLAVAALVRQPVTPTAARSLALAWSMEGKPTAQAERLMRYSEALSRHDTPTQLWLIEAQVQRGDINGALVHYDRAMRTAPEIRGQLIPILVAAADDATVARPLAALIARNPSWRYDFIAAFLPGVKNPATLTVLIPSLSLDPRSGIDRPLLGVAISRLVALGQPITAQHLYRKIAPVAEGHERVNNSDFARDPGPQPFDWSFNTESDLMASREPAEEGGYHLRGTVSAGVSGWLARQTLVLDPGPYRLGISASNDAANGSVLTIRLACIGGAVLSSQPVTSERLAIDVTVPASGCLTAQLSIEAQGGLDGPASDYLIRRVSVTRR